MCFLHTVSVSYWFDQNRAGSHGSDKIVIKLRTVRFPGQKTLSKGESARLTGGACAYWTKKVALLPPARDTAAIASGSRCGRRNPAETHVAALCRPAASRARKKRRDCAVFCAGRPLAGRMCYEVKTPRRLLRNPVPTPPAGRVFDSLTGAIAPPPVRGFENPAQAGGCAGTAGCIGACPKRVIPRPQRISS